MTYLEQARFAHWRSLWGFGNPQTPPDLPGVILAHVEADYKRPTRYGDTLEVRLRVAEIGRSSFRYDYEILDADGALVLTAKTVQVMFDYTANRPVPIPENIRALLVPAGNR